MTLDEAIRHADEKAKELNHEAELMPDYSEDKAHCFDCAKEHEQLAEWLKELKALRERPQGDLISREALKKAFDDTVCIEPMPYAFVKQIIDNAPTVEIPVARWDCYCEGQKVGYEKALSERPQGEWITYDVDITPHPLHCKNCGWSNHHIKNEYIKEFKVCPDCGAEMKGGKEE